MENKIDALKRELKYLTKETIDEEIEKNKTKLNNKNADIKKIARDIYLSRGLDINKLNSNITSNFMNDINTFLNSFKGKDSTTRKKMILDIVYLIILIILMKIPFNLVRDIGYEYIEMLSTNNIFYTTWNLAFLILYTITAICTTLVLIKNFNQNYNK